MKQGSIIQVFRWRGHDAARLLIDIWEIDAAKSVNALTTTVSDAYTDGKDDTYEVLTIIDGSAAATRRLCWGIPGRCRKERLCVVGDDVILDFRTYCADYLS